MLSRKIGRAVVLVESWASADSSKVAALRDEILALPGTEREELAREVLPALLMTPAGLAEIDRVLTALSNQELDGLGERVRHRAADLSEEHIASLITEVLRAARAQSRS
jgi:hypothetical protein